MLVALIILLKSTETNKKLNFVDIIEVNCMMIEETIDLLREDYYFGEEKNGLTFVCLCVPFYVF